MSSNSGILNPQVPSALESCSESSGQPSYQLIELNVRPPLEQRGARPSIRSERFQQNTLENINYKRADYFYNQKSIRQQKSGYSNLRETINEEESILEAFKAIDLNKDSFITKDDLKTFLDYSGEVYTEQQLNEMVRMFDTEERNRVTYDVFRQFARGELTGLCNSFVPSEEVKSNQKIFKNILDNSDAESIRTEEFKRSINRGLHTQKIATETSNLDIKSRSQIKSQKRLSSQKCLKDRRNLLLRHVTINLATLRQEFAQITTSTLDFNTVSELLGLDTKTALLLFDNDGEYCPKQVLMEYAMAVPMGNLQKIETCYQIFTKKPSLLLAEASAFLQFMLPYQTLETWQKRLQMALSKGRVDICKPIAQEALMACLLEHNMIFRL